MSKMCYAMIHLKTVVHFRISHKAIKRVLDGVGSYFPKFDVMITYGPSIFVYFLNFFHFEVL